MSREEQLEALQNKLEGSVEALVTGDDWRRAMEFAALFRSRSWRNTLLIYAQHEAAHGLGLVDAPTPTHVAGYQQWKKLGRQVRRGQPGYQIFAPVTRRFATANPSESDSWRRLERGEEPRPGEVVRKRMVGVRGTYVWDVSQTDGKPLPEQPLPQPLQGQAPAGLWNELANEIVRRGYTAILVDSSTDIAGANGMTDFANATVSVRRDMSDAAQVKTLSHELGHVMLHGPDNADAVGHRGIAEVEAESFELMIGAAHDMATDDYTVPYVSTWASTVKDTAPLDVVQQTAERVRGAAVEVLDRLETVQVPDGTPPASPVEAAPGIAATARRTGAAHERHNPPTMNQPAHAGVAR